MAYRGKSIRTLGIVQMVFGILMGIFGIASLAAVYHWSSYIACGLWVGTWVFLTGLFGYLGARSDTNPNNCLIGVMLGFAVTSCVLTAIMVIIYSIATAEFGEILRCNRYENAFSNHCYNSYYYYHVNYSAEAGIAIAVILLLGAISEFFIALASSIYGCNACCCSAPTHLQTAHQVAYIGPQQGNVVIVPSGGYYPGTTIQTVATYPTQQGAVMMQGVQPAYIQQPYPVGQGQVYNPPPPHPGQAYNPPPTHAQPGQPGPLNPAFQAQSLPAVEKPPPYSYPVPQ